MTARPLHSKQLVKRTKELLRTIRAGSEESASLFKRLKMFSAFREALLDFEYTPSDMKWLKEKLQ